MKTKRTLILALFLIVSLCVFPQKKFEGGLTVGTGFADFRGLDAEYLSEEISWALTEVMEEDFPIEASPRSFTITVGGFLTYNLRPWLGLRAAVEYVPKGMRYSGELYLSTSMNLESEILKYGSTFNLTYLEFPLSVQLSTRSKKKVRNTWFYTNIGVAPAMNLAASYDMTLSLVEQEFNNSGVTDEVIDSESDSEDLDGIASTDLGFLVSAGVVFESIGLDIKLTNGRKNIYENPEDGYIRNNNITASLWIIF